MNADDRSPYLLYDGECPFCTSFSEYYKIKNALPGLKLLSLRDTPAIKALNLPADLDFSQGMILITSDKRYLQGEAALREISKNANISSFKDLFLIGAGSKPWISKLAYPVVFHLRNLYYRLIGKSARIDRADLK